MSLYESRQQNVIRIEENDIFSGACLEPFFRGYALTAIVPPPQYGCAWILPRKIEEDAAAVVRRSIIDDNALYIRVVLCEY